MKGCAPGTRTTNALKWTAAIALGWPEMRLPGAMAVRWVAARAAVAADGHGSVARQGLYGSRGMGGRGRKPG